MERESALIYLFSTRQFIGEYISGKGKCTYIFVFTEAIHLGIYKRKGKATYIFVFTEAIHLGIYKRKGKVHLYICFQ